ncbi:uncharacterized protein G2W53_031135 [Senna tora]|uniref:Uncharacterized protein n=1 Tax=Senna tora TaxID=362788 RepID=A0A834T8P8_9FABA|nr:uncharacterized protein G2W53_031135 [Senna tora]
METPNHSWRLRHIDIDNYRDNQKKSFRS